MNVPAAFAGFIPRYYLYCLAHGAKSPAEMKEIDRARWQGSPGYPYMMWIQEQWRLWCIENKRERHSPKTAEDHAKFDAWLLRKVGSCTPQQK